MQIASIKILSRVCKKYFIRKIIYFAFDQQVIECYAE